MYIDKTPITTRGQHVNRCRFANKLSKHRVAAQRKVPRRTTNVAQRQNALFIAPLRGYANKGTPTDFGRVCDLRRVCVVTRRSIKRQPKAIQQCESICTQV